MSVFKAINGLITLLTIAAVIVAIWMVGSLFGVDFGARFQALFTTQEAIEKLTLSESDQLCLTLEMWHGAEKGVAGKRIMRIVGVAALNYRATAPAEVNMCTIFEKMQLMLSKAHPAESLRGTSVVPLRKVSVVNAEASDTAGAATFAEASAIARELLAATAPSDALPDNLKMYGCAKAFIRSYKGLLSMRIPGGFKTIREDFKNEGLVPLPTIDGFEFFCPAASSG